MTVVTPTVRSAGRRAAFWVSLGVIALLFVAIAALVTRGGAVLGNALSPSNAAPTGSMAVAEVLRGQGVTVTDATNFEQAVAAAAGGDSTIFVVDPSALLDARQLRELGGHAAHLVLMSPSFGQLNGLAPIAQAGVVEGVVEADCDVPAAAAAVRVTGDGVGFRLTDDVPGASLCFHSGDGVYSLVQLPLGDTLLTVVGTWDAFSNGHVAEHGNAALALGLLGGHAELVWYSPTIADAAVPGAPTIAELTPVWLTAALTLLTLSFVALAIVRGRRLGPLAIENLPVTVRASETMEGRARLYQRSSARMHALDSLRIGTLDRVARTLGLSRTADVDEVILAAAARTGTDPHAVRALLLEERPNSDAELIRLSDSLLELERLVHAAVSLDPGALGGRGHRPPGIREPDTP